MGVRLRWRDGNRKRNAASSRAVTGIVTCKAYLNYHFILFYLIN